MIHDPQNPRPSKNLYSMEIEWSNKANDVKLAAEFTNWRPVPMKYIEDRNVWALTVHLRPGVYEYKFIVDGEWKVDVTCPITEESGYQNNYIECIPISSNMSSPMRWKKRIIGQPTLVTQTLSID